MFLRIRERKKRVAKDEITRIARGLHSQHDIYLQFILCANTRVSGKVKQDHIATLGGITEGTIADGNTTKFLAELKKRLDYLANQITPDERELIELGVLAKFQEVTERVGEARKIAKVECEQMREGMRNTKKQPKTDDDLEMEKEIKQRLKERRSDIYKAEKSLHAEYNSRKRS